MLIKTPLFNWKNVFDKTKEEFKVGYDFMCSTDIRILENNFSRYKTDYYVDLFFNGGVIVLELNMQEYRIDSPANFLVQPGDELRILSHDSDLSVFIIVASKSIRDDFLGNFDKNNSVHRAIKAKHLYLVSKKDRIYVDDFINDILKLVKDVDNPFRFYAIKCLHMVYYYRYSYKLYTSFGISGNDVAQRFFELLDLHFRDERKSSFYSEQLSLSVGYFEHILKVMTGKTFKKWLDEKLAMESKRMLNETSDSIEKIAEKMNFKSEDSFGKFFKRVVRLSPKEYRKKF
ncbi:MAG: AraC family transcriptional regulator [Bacteroidales bacterium]|nr:AraC family transcriptional regulator [Bacteroidales bacterium]